MAFRTLKAAPTEIAATATNIGLMSPRQATHVAASRTVSAPPMPGTHSCIASTPRAEPYKAALTATPTAVPTSRHAARITGTDRRGSARVDDHVNDQRQAGRGEQVGHGGDSAVGGLRLGERPERGQHGQPGQRRGERQHHGRRDPSEQHGLGHRKGAQNEVDADHHQSDCETGSRHGQGAGTFDHWGLG